MTAAVRPRMSRGPATGLTTSREDAMFKKSNREATALPFLEIVVEHANGFSRTCPNGLVFSAIWSKTGQAPGTDRVGLMPWSSPMDFLSLAPIDGKSSVISGQPAVLYRTDDVAVPLTPEELYRLAAHSLEPSEYSSLRSRYGLFHEIHEDFYDPESGEALQPMFADERLSWAVPTVH